MSHSPRSRRHFRRRTGLRTPRSIQRRWHVRQRHRRIVAPARFTPFLTGLRSAAFGVALAMLTLPFLVSCARQPSQLPRFSSNQVIAPAPARPESSGTIRYQGLDYDYNGSAAAHSQSAKNQQKGPPIKADTVRRILIRDVLEILVPKFPSGPNEPGFIDGRLHSFRHYFCSNCANSKVPERVLMKWLGHRNSRMVHRYYHLYDEESIRQMKQVKLY